MRSKFPGFYRPKSEDFAKKFKTCIFSFDTNVLLNLYRFTPESRDNLLEVIRAVQERIWLTYQVAYEYHDNREEVIVGQQQIYESVKNGVDDAIKAFDKQRRSANFLVTRLIEPIRKALDEVKADLDKKKADHPDLLKDDAILNALTELFDGKVGDAYEPEEHKKKLALAKQRFEAKIPPGFLDSTGKKKKEGDRKYGDVILWFQLLDFAKKEKKSIILITDETGEDWWQRISGRTIGPRPELAQEMHNEANVWFYMYSTERFLELSKDLLELEVKPEVIKEAKEIQKEVRARSHASWLEGSERNVFSLFHDYAHWQHSLQHQSDVLTRVLSELATTRQSDVLTRMLSELATTRQSDALARVLSELATTQQSDTLARTLSELVQRREWLHGGFLHSPTDADKDKERQFNPTEKAEPSNQEGEAK